MIMCTSPSGRPRRRLPAAVAVVGLAGSLAAGLSTSAGATAQPTVAATTTNQVDTATPVFSHPSRITNPLLPVNATQQFVQLGHEGPEARRQELTLLPATKVIAWNGSNVDARIAQFMAYADGRLIEIAIDYFAQDDTGAVWYFGEDVTNYADGVVVDHHGTWLAGRDGPPGMIMPAHPHVGDVYRPENIPGLVFEETTVDATGLTVDGPRGPVTGAIRVTERSPGAADEVKVFAPGYGEFQTDVAAGDEHTGIALSLPIDERDGAVPTDIADIAVSAKRIFDTASKRDWKQLTTLAAATSAAWSKAAAGPVPPRLKSQTGDAVSALQAAVNAHDAAAARTTAIVVLQAQLDLAEQYVDVDDTDTARLQNWQRQLTVDRNRGDQPGVLSDKLIIAAIRNRISPD